MTITVDIKDANGTQTNHWEGSSQEAADQWIADNSESFPEGYTVEKKDVTDERQALADEADGEAARALGSRCIARLRGVNLRKGLGLDALITIASDPQIQLAKVLLDTGAPAFARGVIEAAGPKYYTAEEIAHIVAPLPLVPTQ